MDVNYEQMHNVDVLNYYIVTTIKLIIPAINAGRTVGHRYELILADRKLQQVQQVIISPVSHVV